MFEPFGSLESVSVPQEGGQSKGFGFVQVRQRSCMLRLRHSMRVCGCGGGAAAAYGCVHEEELPAWWMGSLPHYPFTSNIPLCHGCRLSERLSLP